MTEKQLIDLWTLALYEKLTLRLGEMHLKEPMEKIQETLQQVYDEGREAGRRDART